MKITPVPAKWMTTPKPTGDTYVKFPNLHLRKRISAKMFAALVAAGNGEPTPARLTTGKSLHRYGLAVRQWGTTSIDSTGAPTGLIVITDRGRRLINGETDLT